MQLTFTNTPELCQKFLEAQALYSFYPPKVRYHPGEITVIVPWTRTWEHRLNNVKKFMLQEAAADATVTIDLIG